MPKKRLSSVLPLLVGAIGAIVAFSMGGMNLWQSIQSRNWPQSEGIIRAAEVRKLGVSSYLAEISYDYEVGGVSYRGERVGIGIRMRSKYSGRVQIILQNYTPGKQVAVFYSPTHPEVAVLEPGIFWGTWEQLIVGAGFLLAGCVLWWFGRRKQLYGSRWQG